MDDPSGPENSPPEPRGGTLAKLLAIQSRLETLNDRLGGLEDRLGDLPALREQVTAHTEAIQSLERHQKTTRPGSIWWPALDEAELAEAWPAFLDWLRDVLVTRYPEAARTLSWCWQQHPIAVDALTSAWLTWHAAYIAPGANPDDALYWQTRHRPELIALAAEEVGTCHKKSTGGHRVHLDPDDLPTDLVASFEPVHDRTP